MATTALHSNHILSPYALRLYLIVCFFAIVLRSLISGYSNDSVLRSRIGGCSNHTSFVARSWDTLYAATALV